MGAEAKPWTGRDAFLGTGLVQSARVMDLLDCVAAQKMKDRGTRKVLDAVDGVLVDTSQSHNRKPYSASVARCLTTSSNIYSFSRDSMLVGLEYFALQGHGEWTQDGGLSTRKLRALAGEGIGLPCLAQVIYVLWVLKGFPSKA